MDMELETLRSLSPLAISPLTNIVDSQETRADVAVKARKRIPTEKSSTKSSPEVRKVTANTSVIEKYGSMLCRFERFSN